jgi:DNA-binding NarL/FixJ family response regulator
VAAAGEVPVLALVGAGDHPGDLLRAGVRALLARATTAEALAAALLAAARGLAVLEPGLAAAWLRVPAARVAGDGPDALTPREHEVLGLLAEGLGNKAIAARLDVSEHTAKFHVNAILGKLGAGTRAEAIVLAARRGLIML